MASRWRGRHVLVAGLLATIVLGIGFAGGAVVQRFYGLGNLLKRMNPDYNKPNIFVPEKYHGKMLIFLLSGQSNMEGTGRLSEYVAPDTRGRVFVFTKQYRWIPGKEPLDPTGGVSCAVSFAAQLLEKDPDLVIGLVPTARGGTNIAQWQQDRDDNSLYAQAIKQAKAASLMGKIAGVLFYQGENDAEGDAADHPRDWDQQFGKFVGAMRQDLNDPTLPVVFAQIGPGGKSPLWAIVQERQAAVTLPNTMMVKTSDLKCYGNGIHLDTPSQETLGRRFAEAWWQLAHPSPGEGGGSGDLQPKTASP